MRTVRYITNAWVLLLLVLWVGIEPVYAAGASNSNVRIGRENPFADFQNLPIAVPEQPTAPLEEHPDLLLETVVLKFLDATSLKSVLDRMVTPFGMVAVNEQNNSVVICDTPENLVKVLAEIQKVDRTPQQVMVEVVILDVKLSNDTEIGINWDLLSDDSYDVIYRQNVGSSRLRSTIESATTLGDATAFNTVGLGGDFSVISGSVRHVLHALQQKRDVEILASPSTLVVSGQSASIKAVEEIPYKELIDSATGGQEALSSTQFKEVGVNLQVTAIVTDGNDIFLTVDAEQNVRTGQSEQGVPVVDTRQATTSLLLKDGQMVVIGGLRREEKTEEISQVPLLGDLPIIGILFKNTKTVTSKSELVVLLSPHIDRGRPVPKHVAAKYEYMHSSSLLSERHESDLPTNGTEGNLGAQDPGLR